MTDVTEQLSLAAGTVLDLDGVAVVRCAAAAGYRRVGLRPRAPLTPQRTRQLQQTLADEGVELLDVEVVTIERGPLRAEQIALAEAAAELGARHLLVVSRDPDLHATTDKIRHLCVRLAGSTTTLAVEFMGFTTVPTLQAARRISRRVPRVGVVVDTLHLHRGAPEQPTPDTLEDWSGSYLQLCDAMVRRREPGTTPKKLAYEARHQRLPPGLGVLPLRALTAAVPVDVPIALEVQNDFLYRHREPIGRARFVRRCAEEVLTPARALSARQEPIEPSAPRRPTPTEALRERDLARPRP